MKRRSVRTRGAVTAGAGLVMLAAAALALPSASAAPGDDIPDPMTAVNAGQLATTLDDDLGSATAGSYYDPQERALVVNVTDEETADRVREAGGRPRVVKHSLASLDEARATLKDQAAIPGTAWAMDPRTNQVVVTADSSVTAENMRRLDTVVSSLGDRATVRRSAGTLRPLIAGGDAIWGAQARCSLGFNVLQDGEPYFLTAGHCTQLVESWSDARGGSEVALTEASSFPGDDYGLARYTADIAHPSAVNLYNGGVQEISEVGTAIVGQQVRRSGSTTGLHEGVVTAVNATVNYAEGTVEGLIATTVCAEAGDSGGPLFAGNTGLGLTSGGSGDCTSGGETFYQPLTEALEATGTELG
ncbi:S1 family peptidase [Streptomyces pactum]|uniref:S1 family peptidase n=1 Tax=Streptomyces pactum TaxID=68249 RepID=UPI0035580B1D